jgi:alpha-glucosidase
VYNFNRPEVHDILRRWRRLLAGYAPERLLVGETYLFDLGEVARYYGADGDELDLAFNFPFLFSPLESSRLAAIVEATERALPVGAWPVWTGSNHDAGRLATRWCRDDARCVRCALLLLLTLRGTTFLYYGDELGLGDVAVPRERLLDPAGVLQWPDYPGRDRCRTPMQWSAEPGAGFTRPDAEPWLPLGDHLAVNVDRQRGDDASPLSLTRRLLGLRRRSADLRLGRYEQAVLDGDLWAWRRGAGTLVAANVGGGGVTLPAAALPAARARVSVATDPGREGWVATGDLRLAPWEALVLEALG